MTALVKTDDGLRLMIYDTTDKHTWKRYLADAKEHTPDVIDDIIDDVIEHSDIELGLTTTWRLGGWMYRKLRTIDHVGGFNNWPEALEWAADVEPDRPIKEIQYWGHGSPGKAWMGRKTLTKNAFEPGTNRDALMRIKTRLTEDSLIWFRTCSMFSGDRGHDFAKVWADNMQCRIAAHTYIIGPFQSGLHSLGPGEEPKWPRTEGIAEGTPKRILKGRWSMPWSPNTILALQSHKPENW
jgi:hypothetical protein